MQTADKLIEALLFVALGVAFYWWQMRQIRIDRSKAAEQAAEQAAQHAREAAPPSRESRPDEPRT
jgi:uncharacterized protein HemX